MKTDKCTQTSVWTFSALRVDRPAPPVAPDYKVCWIASIYLQHTAIDQSHSRHFKTGVKFPGYIYFHSESGAPSGARLQNMLNSFGICLAYCYWPVAFKLFYLLVLSIRVYLFSQPVGRPQWRSTTKYATLLRYMFSILQLTSRFRANLFTGVKYQSNVYFHGESGAPE